MSNNDYLELFLSEAQEILDTLSRELIHVEQAPNEQKPLEELFRGCHTLKGNAAAMGFDSMVTIAHAMENILSHVRSQDKPLTAFMVDGLFAGLDGLNALVNDLEQQKESALDINALMKRLKSVIEEVSSDCQGNDAHKKSRTSELPSLNEKKFNHHQTNVTSSTVRVHLNRLESLMNAVGELHLCKVRLMTIAKQLEQNALTKVVSELERVVDQLQEETIEMRLLPLSYLFNFFPRMIRDDARNEQKQVQLTFSGADIGLDRTILDEINDPLLHLLRNAVIHGIEPPDVRRKKGKPETGLIHVSAHREQDMVVLCVQDDGAGINPQLIKKRLKEQGMMSTSVIEKLSDEDVLMMITLPGFSLSEQVTKRAGRGIGMNVVKNKIDAIGGWFSIKSTLDKGTTFMLHLPISMAIIHALLVGVADDIFALPLYYVLETLRVNTSSIQHVNHQMLITFKEGALPLVNLKQCLGFEHSELEFSTTNVMSVVVCNINQQRVGLLVEQLFDEQEIVIKNLNHAMQNIKIFSGATILGDGRVAFILDVPQLMR